MFKTQRMVIDVDPDGDVVIEVGTNFSELFRVSKQRLISVSPVFKTMLGPDFAEGQKSHTESDPLELPDDSVPGMWELFNIAHFRSHASPSYGTLDLGLLVIVCDKYDCITPFRVPLAMALERWEREFSTSYNSPGVEPQPKDDGTTDVLFDGADPNMMLAVAFLLNHGPAFSNILNRLFRLKGLQYFRILCDGQMEALLPTGYRDGLVRAFTATMERVRPSLYTPLDDLLTAYASLPSCSAKLQLAGICSHAIYKDELLPHKCSGAPRNYIKQNWTHYLPAMESEIRKCSKSCCRKTPSQCLTLVRACALKALGKVCLQCFKKGNYEDSGGKLRTHREGMMNEAHRPTDISQVGAAHKVLSSKHL